MNEASSACFTLNESDFTDIVVQLNDGNQILMQKCIKCYFVVRKQISRKCLHLRLCPSKYLFKYQHKHDDVDNQDVTVKCLVCQCTLLRPKDSNMRSHYLKCGQRQPSSKMLHIVANSFEDDLMIARNRLNGIEYVTENTVSEVEKRGVKAVSPSGGFKTLYVKTSRGLERFYECQICLKQMKNYIWRERHRRFSCPLQDDEVLITVATQPTSSTPSDNSLITARVKRICFICNTKISESYTFVDENILSQHSRTPLILFMRKFLDDKPSVRSDAATKSCFLCEKCIEKMNAYDFACVKSAKLEDELRRVLSYTEAAYSESLNEGAEVLEISPDIEQLNENEPSDQTQTTIELSDDEREAKAIEISDDEFLK